MGEPERSYDGSKRLAGRKRHPLPDAGGLVLTARVHTARLHVLHGERELPKRRTQGGMPPSAVVRGIHRGMGGSEPKGAKWERPLRGLLSFSRR
jgi:hypothetical protein